MIDLKLTIYLAGTSPDNGYRQFVVEKYGYYFIFHDPLKNITKEIVSQMIGDTCGHIFVVRRDKKWILDSDILVAYIKNGISTFGTSMEIIFAYSNSIPVFVIDETKKTFEDYWVKFHTTKFFVSIDECFNYILNGGSLKFLN